MTLYYTILLNMTWCSAIYAPIAVKLKTAGGGFARFEKIGMGNCIPWYMGV
jgi:hypothetical protein